MDRLLIWHGKIIFSPFHQDMCVGCPNFLTLLLNHQGSLDEFFFIGFNTIIRSNIKLNQTDCFCNIMKMPRLWVTLNDELLRMHALHGAWIKVVMPHVLYVKTPSPLVFSPSFSLQCRQQLLQSQTFHCFGFSPSKPNFFGSYEKLQSSFNLQPFETTME